MINSIKNVNEKQCVSCRACELICSQKAIKMVENEEGFLYPVVTEQCTNCGLCKKCCPILNYHPNKQHKNSYLVQNLNDSVLSKSTSGGFFYAISEWIIDQGGVVFGAAYDDLLNVKQIYVDNKNDLYKLQGSKYVESDTIDSFLLVKNFLKNNITVLYTGVACQIAGLKAFLGHEYKNLITVDIICHGVPSRKLFHKYVDFLGKKFKEEIIYVGFRDKDVAGWTCGGKIKTKTKTKTKTINGITDPYYASFMRRENYRESCYNCLYQNTSFYRPSDFSIGDFFEVDYLAPEKNNKKGLSLVVVNSITGEGVFDNIKEKFRFETIEEKEYLPLKGNLITPSVRPQIRNSIYKGIDEPKYFKSYRECKISFWILFWIISFVKFLYSKFPERVKNIYRMIREKQ